MSTQIFVNLPMKDLERSRALFTALGYSFNPQFSPQFSDENAGCLVISDDIYAILLVEPYFKTFIKKKLADATKSTETIIALSADSPAEVDKLADKALAAGATLAREPEDQGLMYGRSFQDPDGHIWEVFWMDPSAIQG